MDNYSDEMICLRRNWAGMWERCANPKNKGYPDYGGRGIYVCDDWADFRPFAEWALTNGYHRSLQLDRIDNDGPYSPENCKYVTASENSNNRRSNSWLTAFGETKTLTQWSRDPRCVVTQSTLRRRIDKFGWIPEEAITLKSRKNRTRYCPQGHLLTEETTYQRGNGYRMCAECAKEQQKKQYYKEHV